MTQLDPETMGRNGQLAMEGAAAIGASGAPISRNAGNCVQCSSCPFGCEIDAKRGMHVSYLPRAVAAGARIRAGVEVERVLVEDGRAVGVELLDRRRRRPRPFTVRARRAVIVAGGAFGTPELLLRSGLGGGQVGRNLHIHPACWVGARYEEEVRGWDGVMQSYYVDEWEHARDPARGDLHPARLRRRLAARRRRSPPGGDARLRPRRLDRRPPLRPLLGPRRARRRGLAAGQLQADRRRRRPARLRHRPRRRSPLRRRRHRGLPQHRPRRRAQARRPGRVRGDPFKPSELRLEAFHPMGTARIAADPARGRLRHRRLPSTAPTTSTSPTPPSSPPRSASTR